MLVTGQVVMPVPIEEAALNQPRQSCLVFLECMLVQLLNKLNIHEIIVLRIGYINSYILASLTHAKSVNLC